ncbi:hypothetical protein GGR51DRAFT_576438 [Nemania sp. FL0031]|nr:hypothetical protein GGR51DRAFT_576438 [Nemania sp. FL0031]
MFQTIKAKTKPPHDYTIEDIKLQWSQDLVYDPEDLAVLSQLLWAELCHVIENHGYCNQEEPIETPDLEEFLENEEGTFRVDDCIMWLMLSTLATEPETPARRMLSQIIIKLRPMIAFFPANQDSCACDAWNLQPKDNHFTFQWRCKANYHKEVLNTRLRAGGSSFIKSVASGNAEMVKHTIDNTKIYLERSVPQQNSKSYASIIRNLEHGQEKTALKIALKQYTVMLESSQEDLSSSYMKIFEYLLEFNPPPNDEDNILRQAIQKDNINIIKKILDRTPDMSLDKLVLDQLNHLGGNLEITKELIMRLGARSRISADIFKTMVTVNIPSLWDLPPIWKLLAEQLETNLDHGRDLLDRAISSGQQHIVKRMIQMSPETFDLNLARKMIELNKWKMWKEEIRNSREPLLLEEFGAGLLSFAVRMQREKFVKHFVKDSPGLVLELYPKDETMRHDNTDTGDQHLQSVYPLWHNNFEMINGSERSIISTTEARREIRKALVSACIRQMENMETLCEIFQHSGESVADISLDLSQFNSKFFPFTQLVKSLVRYKGEFKIASYRYEPTLRYVDFPALDFNGHDRRVDGYQSHSEVFDLLNWLQTEHGVDEIIRLKVPDRMFNPHDERTIAQMVKRFQIQVLDWRFLDLSISVFLELKPEVDCLRSIHLYASGKRAVVSHWLSPQGILSLPNVKDVKIHLVEELMSDGQARTLSEILTNGFSKLEIKRPGFKFEINSECWDIQPVRSNTSLGHIAERAVPKLWPLIDAYRNHVVSLKKKDGWKATRIAIIDNGIMSIAPFIKDSDDTAPAEAKIPQADQVRLNHDSSAGNNYDEIGLEEPLDCSGGKPARGPHEDETGDEQEVPHSLSSRVVKGRSFLADEYRLGSWSFASDPHGTQMANLICAIDPHCEILVAKVTEGRFGVDAEHLASAVKWAVEERADIISMSLATYELDSGGRLVAEIQNAKSEGVLMLCATHDEGLNVVRSYPANIDGTVTIAASNQFGGVTENAPSSHDYDYRFHATNITIGVVPFIQSEEAISGSSVATAIAAGLSSLILSCRRLAIGSAKEIKGWRCLIVKHKLDQTKDKNSKYVQLEKFCNIGELVKGNAPIDMEEIIGQFNKENLPYVA